MIGDVQPKSQEQKRLDAQETGSGGVGEDLGNGNERFNAYDDSGNHNTINSGSYNHAEGDGNTLNGCYATHIDGYGNTATLTQRSSVSGERNTVINANAVSVSGYNNNVNGNCHTVSGSGNTISGGYADIVSGQGNQVTGTDDIVSGMNNTVTASDAVVCGNRNTASGSNSVVAGDDNNCSASRSVTCGAENINSASSSMMCGHHGYNSSHFFAIGNGTSSSTALCFYVTDSGNVYAAGAYRTIGADYAEYFEWADGNPGNEDRRGMLVRLEGDKIVPADSDEILGAVSSRPSVVGNSCEEHWRGKYKTDIFGDYILDENGERQLSGEYDTDMEYIPRSQRPEWAAVGLVGRLIVTDNGECTPGGYITAQQGIAVPTFTETRIRCLKRLDDTHIEILVR